MGHEDRTSNLMDRREIQSTSRVLYWSDGGVIETEVLIEERDVFNYSLLGTCGEIDYCSTLHRWIFSV